MIKSKKTTNKKSLPNRQKILLGATIIILIPILNTIVRNGFHAIKILGEISQLNDEAETYRESIRKDSILLEGLKYNDRIEEYAREHYFMQRRGEKVFIIE